MLNGTLISLALILIIIIYIGIPALAIIGLITVIKWTKKKLAAREKVKTENEENQKNPPT